MYITSEKNEVEGNLKFLCVETIRCAFFCSLQAIQISGKGQLVEQQHEDRKNKKNSDRSTWNKSHFCLSRVKQSRLMSRDQSGIKMRNEKGCQRAADGRLREVEDWVVGMGHKCQWYLVTSFVFATPPPHVKRLSSQFISLYFHSILYHFGGKQINLVVHEFWWCKYNV